MVVDITVCPFPHDTSRALPELEKCDFPTLFDWHYQSTYDRKFFTQWHLGMFRGKSVLKGDLIPWLIEPMIENLLGKAGMDISDLPHKFLDETASIKPGTATIRDHEGVLHAMGLSMVVYLTTLNQGPTSDSDFNLEWHKQGANEVLWTELKKTKDPTRAVKKAIDYFEESTAIPVESSAKALIESSIYE